MPINVCFLDHPWIKEDGEAPDVPLDNAVMSRLKQFKAMNNFKKVALRVSLFCLLKSIYIIYDDDSIGLTGLINRL